MDIRLTVNYPPGDVWSLTPFLRDFREQRQNDRLFPATPCPEILAGAPYSGEAPRGRRFDRDVEFRFPPCKTEGGVNFYGVGGGSMREAWYEWSERILGIRVEPRTMAAEFYPTEREKAYSIVPLDRPVCVLNAGWKSDIPVKYWGAHNFAAVVEALHDRVLFVQVGRMWRGQDHHDPVPGAMDMRGKTSLRELAVLVYHADFVLTGISQLHHAAGMPCYKPRHCITVAGAREPENWANCYRREGVTWHWLSARTCRGEEPGCWESKCPACPAMASIEPEKVISIIEDTL